MAQINRPVETIRTSGAEGLLEITIDGELEGSKGADHEETGADTRVRAPDAELLADLDQAGSGALAGSTLGLVDLAKHGVGRLGDDGGSETSGKTRAKVDNGLHAVGEVLLGEDTESSLSDLLVDDELGHGVGDPRYQCEQKGLGDSILATKNGSLLLEEDRSESGVESTDTLSLEHLGETTNQAIGIGGFGDETDTGGLERAEGDVGEELGGTGRGEVDTGSVVGGSLVAEEVDRLLLEELVSTELERTLEEVTGEGRADTGQESTSALGLDDLAETTDHAIVVGRGVELDAGLDAVFISALVTIETIESLLGHKWAHIYPLWPSRRRIRQQENQHQKYGRKCSRHSFRRRSRSKARTHQRV